MDHAARRLVLFGVATIGLLALAACGGGEPSAPEGDGAGGGDKPPDEGAVAVPAVSVSGADYSFDAPDSIAAGRTTLRFTNEGQEPHELQLMRFNDGVLIHEFMGTLHEGEGLEAALQMVSSVGGVESIGPGQTAGTTVDLPEGEYLLISLVESPDDGVADALKGMVKPLTVTAAP